LKKDIVSIGGRSLQTAESTLAVLPKTNLVWTVLRARGRAKGNALLEVRGRKSRMAEVLRAARHSIRAALREVRI